MRWIVFDYGEVISRRTQALPTLASLLGASLDAFESVYWPLREPYDRGWTDLEYWREVGSRVGVEVDEVLATKLTEADINGWLVVDPDVLALLEELRGTGHGLALLSNAPVSHGQAFRQQPWAANFAHVVISAELRTAKPDAEIWAALLERLEAAPADCVFFDDKPTNIQAAKVAGLDGQVWKGHVQARSYLEQRQLLSRR